MVSPQGQWSNSSCHAARRSDRGERLILLFLCCGEVMERDIQEVCEVSRNQPAGRACIIHSKPHIKNKKGKRFSGLFATDSIPSHTRTSTTEEQQHKQHQQHQQHQQQRTTSITSTATSTSTKTTPTTGSMKTRCFETSYEQVCGKSYANLRLTCCVILVFLRYLTLCGRQGRRGRASVLLVLLVLLFFRC